jgi:hypothetical protein
MNETTMNALQAWLAPDWWRSNDDDKLYLFVFAPWQEFGKMWNEGEQLAGRANLKASALQYR